MTPTMAAAGLGSVDADTRGVYHRREDMQQRSIESLKLLLDAGGDINAKDSPWPDARCTKRPAGAGTTSSRSSSTHGADLDAKDAKGNTPVDSALGKAGGNSRGGAAHRRSRRYRRTPQETRCPGLAGAEAVTSRRTSQLPNSQLPTSSPTPQIGSWTLGVDYGVSIRTAGSLCHQTG